VLSRILTIALNTYREAVRARVLLGVLAVALATCAYSLVVATLSLHNEARVVADLGAASLSLFAVLATIILGSTSLYRELEHKTIFPILSRPIRRWEYLLGKYAGALLTVGVFICVDAAAAFVALALETSATLWKVGATPAVMFGILAVTLVRARHTRVFTVIPWAVAFAIAGWLLAAPSPDERQLIAAGALLSICEVAIVAAVATLFSSFSSPALTATFTAMIFVIGRSTDTMAHFPPKQLGPEVSAGLRILSHVFPNLHLYVPSRALLLGQAPGQPLWPYVAQAALHAVCYAAVLLVVSAAVFRKRDFA
jgi:ABC-type transport system involved in multi-copper enzyme maturation permease subunit